MRPRSLSPHVNSKIRGEVIASLSAQQNAILERSVARITHFQSLISGLVRPPTTAEDAAGSQAQELGQDDVLAGFQKSSRAMLDGDDISDQDRKVLVAVGDVVDELHLERHKNAALQKQLEETEQQLTALRWKNNALATEAQEAALKQALEVEALKQELARLARLERADKAVQTDRRGGGIDDDDDDDGSEASAASSRKSRASRRRLVGSNDDDDDLILKNRRTNKFGVGIASLIEQAKIPSSRIRKILLKRKPLTLNELHAIIVGYYQAKLFQDAQDDAAGKLRANLAQFIMEMYVLHYGLKDLAISQLVFLDASIRKHARVGALCSLLSTLLVCRANANATRLPGERARAHVRAARRLARAGVARVLSASHRLLPVRCRRPLQRYECGCVCVVREQLDGLTCTCMLGSGGVQEGPQARCGGRAEPQERLRRRHLHVSDRRDDQE